MTRPRWSNDHALLAAVAKHLVPIETEEMRQLVTAGHVGRPTGLAHVRAMRAVATGWTALAAIEPEPPHLYDGDQGGAWPFERRQALERALKGAQARAAGDPHDPELAGIADAVATLIWWETADPSARFLVDTTIAWRTRPALTLGVAA